MSDTKLLSLSEIFNNKIFRIPDFQRGYSWEERQLDDFWEDIQNLSPNKIHYIGLLTVEPINANEVSNIENGKMIYGFSKGAVRILCNRWTAEIDYFNYLIA